jgi:hypothetical protein
MQPLLTAVATVAPVAAVAAVAADTTSACAADVPSPQPTVHAATAAASTNTSANTGPDAAENGHVTPASGTEPVDGSLAAPTTSHDHDEMVNKILESTRGKRRRRQTNFFAGTSAKDAAVVGDTTDSDGHEDLDATDDADAPAPVIKRALNSMYGQFGESLRSSDMGFQVLAGIRKFLGDGDHLDIVPASVATLNLKGNDELSGREVVVFSPVRCWDAKRTWMAIVAAVPGTTGCAPPRHTPRVMVAPKEDDTATATWNRIDLLDLVLAPVFALTPTAPAKVAGTFAERLLPLARFYHSFLATATKRDHGIRHRIPNLKNNRAKNNWKPARRYVAVYHSVAERQRRIDAGDPDTVYDISQSTVSSINSAEWKVAAEEVEAMTWPDLDPDDDDFVEPQRSGKQRARGKGGARPRRAAATQSKPQPAPPTPASSVKPKTSTSTNVLIADLTEKVKSLESLVDFGPGKTTLPAAIRSSNTQLAQVKKTAAAATSKLTALSRRVETLERRVRDIEANNRPVDDVVDTKARDATSALSGRIDDLEKRLVASEASSAGAGAGSRPPPEAPSLSVSDVEKRLRLELEAKNAQLAEHQAREVQEALVTVVTARVLARLRQSAPAPAAMPMLHQGMTSAVPAPSSLPPPPTGPSLNGLVNMINHMAAATQRRGANNFSNYQ